MLRCWMLALSESERRKEEDFSAISFFFGWMKNECKFKETTATFVNQEQKCCFRRQQQQWHQPERNLLSCSPPFSKLMLAVTVAKSDGDYAIRKIWLRFISSI